MLLFKILHYMFLIQLYLIFFLLRKIFNSYLNLYLFFFKIWVVF